MASQLEELIARYQGPALGFLKAKVGDENTAQDLYQSVVESLLQSQKTFASLAHLRNYFFVALRNAATDYGRHRTRSKHVSLPEELAEETTLAASAAPEARLAAAEELAAAKARVKSLRHALAELNDGERRLIEQRFFEKLTFREIHEQTDVAISTLKSREEAILRRLRKKLGNPRTVT